MVCHIKILFAREKKKRILFISSCFNWLPPNKRFMFVCTVRCLALKPVHNNRFCRLNAWENEARGMRYQIISSYQLCITCCIYPQLSFSHLANDKVNEQKHTLEIGWCSGAKWYNNRISIVNGTKWMNGMNGAQHLNHPPIHMFRIDVCRTRFLSWFRHILYESWVTFIPRLICRLLIWCKQTATHRTI